MWQQSRHFGVGASHHYGTPSHYRTPPPPSPPARENTNFPHYEGEVIDIDSENERVTHICAVELMASLEESVTSGTTNVPKDSENGANKGGSDGSKKRRSPNILDFFPMAPGGL